VSEQEDREKLLLPNHLRKSLRETCFNFQAENFDLKKCGEER